MRLKPHTVGSHIGSSAPAAFLVAFFFLACHGAPGTLHQSAHVEAAGSHHGASVSAAADHAGVDESAGPHDAAQSGSGTSADYYAAAFLTLLLGAALFLARARVVRRARWAIVARSFSPPRWRPPPPPTPVRLQVFRL